MTEFEISQWSPRSSGRNISSVFHYTDAVGLLSIIRRGTLWATEAAAVNDSQEVTAGIRELERLISTVDDPELKDLLSSETSGPRNAATSGPSGVFVLSASFRSDDANQWRLYGDNGAGYCIELDSTVRMVVRSEGTRHDGKVLRRRPDGKAVIDLGSLADFATVIPWVRVLYTVSDYEQTFDQLISWLRSEKDRADNAPPWDPEDGEPGPGTILKNAVDRAKATFTRIVKSAGFEGEAETRTVVTFALGDKHVQFRAGRYGITRYVELASFDQNDFSDSASDFKNVWFADEPEVHCLPIRSIMLGPKINPQLNRKAVESLLQHHKYESVKVKSSAVPLR